MFEQLRDRWEHWTPRERRLMMLLGVALVVSVFLFIGKTIGDGLDDIDKENAKRREALAALEVYRAQQAVPQDGPKVKIPDEAVDLNAYLENIASPLSLKIPSYQPQPDMERGNYVEVSVSIDLRDITVQDLASFLEQVETKNRTVVVTNLKVERSFRDQEKLRTASMTVATFAKKKKAKPAPGAAAGAGG